jgi:hypothetical protein
MEFPSTEWFQALKTEADADVDTFRRLGFCDALAVVEVSEGDSSRRFALDFKDYGLDTVRELATGEEVDADFELVAGIEVWQEMIENIAANGGADLAHTLAHLQLPGIIELRATDQLRADIFYRCNGSYQEYFNKAANVPTTFAVAAV